MKRMKTNRTYQIYLRNSLLLLLLFLMMSLSSKAQEQTKLINIAGRVYGGACQADVGGSTFVNIGSDNFDVLINAVYGGNDVSGEVGTSATKKPDGFTPEIESIDDSFDAFIHVNPSSTGNKLFIGMLFGGGNGAYDYSTGDYAGKSAPELGKSYLQINGGTISRLFGGGNNATVTENTTICIDNTSTVVKSMKVGETELLNNDRLKEMGLNPSQVYIDGDFQFGRVFGGNNFADMAIRPKWYLKKGKIRDLYSGGNEGRMTSPEGLLLEINADVENAVTTDADVLWINNVYGGCRKANVQPLYADGTPVPTSSIKLPDSENQGQVPAGFSARVRVLKGYVNNVYGGNDISGTVYGGNTVGIFTTIHGNVYGGGNGSYAYTDNPDLANDATWGDFYYAAGDNSVEALNAHRPNAERVSIRVSGTDTKRTIVEGALYAGGNSATLEKKSADIKKATAELKIGSYVTIDKVFLGNNGENMVDPTILAKYADNDFSFLNLKNEETFAKYMEGCALKIDPDVVFDDGVNSPDEYVPYSTLFGSFYCGGNVGSIIKDGLISIDFNHEVIIYNKVVGGCNNAKVSDSDYNAAYEGGLIGAADGNGNKLELNLNGLKIQPKRWKDETNKALGLEWNTFIDDTKVQIASNEPIGTASDNDKNRRFKDGNIYGGCYNSGVVNGNVVINIKKSIVDRTGEYGVFDIVETDEETGESLYGHDGYTITERRSGVILDEQGMDVLGSALNVFGGGKGAGTSIYGSTTINLESGYVFQVFGGSEEGVIGAKDNNGNYTYNANYSTHINLKGSVTGVARGVTGDSPNMAEAEFIYGGGFEGLVCGDTHINLGNGRVFNTFAGSCNADILGHTETYVGRNSDNDEDLGFPYIRDHIYGGNDLGGQILGEANFKGRVNTSAQSMVYNPKEKDVPDVVTASAYTEYIQGRVDYIFGGCYGVYDYSEAEYASVIAKDGFIKPRLNNAFVNFKPVPHPKSSVTKIYGAGQGYTADSDRDVMQNRSYILIDAPQEMTHFQNMEVFGAGDFSGLGMSISGTVAKANEDGVTSAAVIDLVRGQIAAVYGGSYNEGVTRRTIVNVPENSTISLQNIFGGAYGVHILPPCDVFESNVNYRNTNEKALVSGAIYGGNNSERRTLYAKVNIFSPVWSNKTLGDLAKVYGAGKGLDTWAEYTEVNLESGAKVYEVYGGGQLGHVLNAESVQRYMNLYKDNPSAQISRDDPNWSKADRWVGGNVGGTLKEEWKNAWKDDWKAAWTIGGDYYVSVGNFVKYIEQINLNNEFVTTRPAEMDERTFSGLSDEQKARIDHKYNTNVIINEGATVVNYAYGGGWGEAKTPLSGDVYGTTYIALLGGTVNKDIYAAGTSGSVYNLFGADVLEEFTASVNAYVKGGTVRNVFGGGWRGSVGYHSGAISNVANNSSDEDGEAHVVIGDLGGTSLTDGIPSIKRNVYGGGEGGAIYGDAYVTINNGYIGYHYNAEGTDDPKTSDFNETYEQELDDEVVGDNKLDKGGNVFGGGYVANSYVDRSHVTMYDGVVRGSLYGGGEIGPIGRGTVHSDTLKVDHIQNYIKHSNSVQPAAIFKEGKTEVYLYGGHVMRDVFGGGRGYDNWGGEGYMTDDEKLTMDRSSKGYVFGSTNVHIRGGEIGTREGALHGFGNVFGGGNEGFVYSFEGQKVGTIVSDDQLENGLPEGGGGYYYKGGVISNGLSIDCNVVVEPYCKVFGNSVTIDGVEYAVGSYVPTEALDKLGNKNGDSSRWEHLYKGDNTDGIIIHNAVFAGGNITEGSDKLFANTITVYGNAAASLRDIFNRDLISIGTDELGGLYGDGNLTLVDGFRELHMDNYGTDYYSLDDNVDYNVYKDMSDREKAYYQLKYVANNSHSYHYWESKSLHDGYRKGQKIPYGSSTYNEFSEDEKKNWAEGIKHYIGVGENKDEIDDIEWSLMDEIEQQNWTLAGVFSIYAGRPMNTIQRADFCGVFGSRMVLKGAQDRVPQVVDYTDYTINRVDEVSLNQRRSGDNTHGNYFGIYNSVNYLGNLTSDVRFEDAHDIRVTTSTSSPADGTTTYYSWKANGIQAKDRNNGTSMNKVALASGVYLEIKREESESAGEDKWGYITGVVELDLINVMQGMGGGYVYAKNEHGAKTYHENYGKVSLLEYNSEARTYRKFSYSTTDIKDFETSGNFVHFTKQIVDDCYPNSGMYRDNYASSPAHYWFIKGTIYVYDQYISAFTGAANAYAEKVELPLTIAAASNGRLTLREVQPNYYAYYDKMGKKLGTAGAEETLVIKNATYHLNDPISYWDYRLLSDADKDHFEEETYTTIAACKVGETPYPEGYTMLPSDYSALKASAPKKKLKEDDPDEGVPYVYHEVQKKDVAFDFVFRRSNNLGHDTGYILTFDVNNPGVWDNYYSQISNADQANKLNTKQYNELTSGKGNYTEGPTYTPKVGQSNVYGQHEYRRGSIISNSVKSTYDSNVLSRLSDEQKEDQALVEQAYIVTGEIIVEDANGNEVQILNPGVAIAKGGGYPTDDRTIVPYSDVQWQSIITSGNAEPATVCTSLIEFSPTDYVWAGAILSSAEVTALKAKVREKYDGKWTDEQFTTYFSSVFENAWYCTKAGSYGGSYFNAGNAYRAIETFCSMSKEDRDKFDFNYDGLDLLIDPTFSGRLEANYGDKPQYDGWNKDGTKISDKALTPKVYSVAQPVDYTAEYTGSEPCSYQDENNESHSYPASTNPENWLKREVYEDIPNEKHHYSPIIVTAPGNYYVAKKVFMQGDLPYTAGQVIEEAVYNSMSADQKTNVDIYTFSSDYTSNKRTENGKDVYDPKTYYYCHQSYKVNEKGEGKAVYNLPITKNGETVEEQEYDLEDIVPQGIIIRENTDSNNGKIGYDELVNKQAGFVIHGTSPTEVSTLYVSSESDIFDLSKEKIITVIYLYEYEESDASGLNVTPVSERHIVNIHINFKSGVPQIDELKEPSIVLPGTTVVLETPTFSQGAYRVTESGWELFTNQSDAETHTNGQEYYNNETPLYWYQDGYWVAYYAQTYLGRTYSNAVQFRVANYHDLKKLMDDKEHHYYIDHKDVERQPKIYINDYSGSGQNGLDLFKDLIDLSHIDKTYDSEGNPVPVSGGRLDGHVPLDLTHTSKPMRGGQYLDFFLHDNLSYTDTDAENDWTPIANGSGECFSGTLHGEGHTISGLDNSLFNHLCGNVYNLGVMGSFTGAGVAETGEGYVENCWVKTTTTTLPNGASKVNAVFGNPTDNTGYQLVNSYFWSGNAALYNTTTNETTGVITSGGDRGKARAMDERSFYNGELSFDLNGFYLYKRYCDNNPVTGGLTYPYYTVSTNNSKTLHIDDEDVGHYSSSAELCSSGVNGGAYVEERYKDGDFRYADGSIPTSDDIRQYTVKDANNNDVIKFAPIWPDDYLFFGQSLTFDYNGAHQSYPTNISKSGGRLIIGTNSNRVYRAPAYYGSKTMGVAHFNPVVNLAAYSKSTSETSNDGKEAYPGMTAIDFAGHNGGEYVAGLSGNWFYPPLLDDDGIESFANHDETRNLLVYAPADPGENGTHTTFGVLNRDVKDLDFSAHTTENDPYNRVKVATTASSINGHLVLSDKTTNRDHLLVDKEDFNCPIAYTMGSGKRMWYQRKPDNYVTISSGDKTIGWEGISLPFAAELVSTQDKGEITHFYSDSKTGHEYWLREYKGGQVSSENSNIFVGKFNAIVAGSNTKNYTNTYLWDTYYSHDDDEHVTVDNDMNGDVYQKDYYKTAHEYSNYPYNAVGTPYLVGFPGASYYEFDLSGNWTPQNRYQGVTIANPGRQTISFVSAKGASIGVSDTERHMVTADGYTYVPNYINKKFATKETAFVMADDGGSYVMNAANAIVSAFRPYIVEGSVNGTRGTELKENVERVVFENDSPQILLPKGDPRNNQNDGTLDIYAKKQKVVVESNLRYVTDVRIVNVAGMTLSSFSIEPGETVETRVESAGVYIVYADNGKYVKKVIVK